MTNTLTINTFIENQIAEINECRDRMEQDKNTYHVHEMEVTRDYCKGALLYSFLYKHEITEEEYHRLANYVDDEYYSSRYGH